MTFKMEDRCKWCGVGRAASVLWRFIKKLLHAIFADERMRGMLGICEFSSNWLSVGVGEVFARLVIRYYRSGDRVRGESEKRYFYCAYTCEKQTRKRDEGGCVILYCVSR